MNTSGLTERMKLQGLEPAHKTRGELLKEWHDYWFNRLSEFAYDERGLINQVLQGDNQDQLVVVYRTGIEERYNEELTGIEDACHMIKQGHLKDDRNKPKFSLIYLSLLEQVASVRAWATEHKYPDPEGWRPAEPEMWLEAALRHIYFELLNRRMSSTQPDPESGLPHAAHAATSLMFYLEAQNESDNSENS